ncbi:MAG: ATP-binding protein [Verrucomicrobiota bacterium]
MLLRFLLFSALVAVADAAESGAAASQGVVELVDQSRVSEVTDLGRAWELAEQARAIARTPYDRALVELRRGALQRRRGDYNEAMATARGGLALAEPLRDDDLIAQYFHLLGHTAWSLGDFPETLEYYRRSAALAGKTGNSGLAARAHTGMAGMYRDLGDKAAALPHHEAALRLAEKSGDRRILADVLNNFGNYQSFVGNYADSMATHRRALALREEMGSQLGIADSYFNLAATADMSGKPGEALVHFARAQKIYETLGIARNLANLHHSTAEVLRGMGRFDEALGHLRESEKLAKPLNAHLLWANLYEEYALLMEARGDFRAAVEYQKKYMAANEEVRGERTRKQVAALNVRYETERRQHEIALLRRDQELKEVELRRAHTLRYGLIGLILVGGLAVAAIVSRQRLKLATERRVHDETRAAKEAAERADAFKTRLVGIASHDLKAPVAAMIVGAESLRNEPGDPVAVAAMAQMMVGEGRRTLTLIRDLLDLAALENGRLELECMPLEIAGLVRECLSTLEPRAQAKEQTLTCRVEPGAEHACVSADPARLRQVIDNLADNAIKFTPAGKSVEVSVTALVGIVRVAVKDSGPGLSPEDYVKIFQPFQKLSARPTGGEASTGLGLSIARELITLHGGQMIVDSVPGEGATFSFELPAVEPPES